MKRIPTAASHVLPITRYSNRLLFFSSHVKIAHFEYIVENISLQTGFRRDACKLSMRFVISASHVGLDYLGLASDFIVGRSIESSTGPRDSTSPAAMGPPATARISSLVSERRRWKLADLWPPVKWFRLQWVWLAQISPARCGRIVAGQRVGCQIESYIPKWLREVTIWMFNQLKLSNAPTLVFSKLRIFRSATKDKLKIAIA